jgi:16S rRNA (guanine527-N7)-methyltransferase
VTGADPFAPGPLEDSIDRRARQCGIQLDPRGATVVATHARAVLAANARLNLTTIVAFEEFLERHIGESLEGAAVLDASISGTHLDVGTGNGYPALPLAVARPGLRSYLVEASMRKAEFLRRTIAACELSERIAVIERHVQRAADVPEADPARVLTLRAVGGWSRLMPKLAALLASDGVALLWGGEDVEAVRRREAWKRLELIDTRALPGLTRAFLWIFRRAS